MERRLYARIVRILKKTKKIVIYKLFFSTREVYYYDHYLNSCIEDINYGIYHVVYWFDISSYQLDYKRLAFNSGTYDSEEEYKKHLERMQPLIDEYQENGFINDEISKDLREEFYNSFFYRANCVFANFENGKYRFCTNGRHRLYVARKYKFKIICFI